MSSTLSAKPTCTCGALKKITEYDEQQKLLKFLMHLNGGYESIRGQLLLMDPLPSVSKAYSLIQQSASEKQKQISGNLNANIEAAAYMSNLNTLRSDNSYSGGNEALTESTACMAGKNGGKGNYNNSDSKKDFKEARRLQKLQRFCNHCKERGHTMDQCFKIHGFPECFKGKQKKSYNVAANAMLMDNMAPDSPLDDSVGVNPGAMMYQGFMNALAQEVMRLMKGKQVAEHTQGVGSSSGSFANFAESC